MPSAFRSTVSALRAIDWSTLSLALLMSLMGLAALYSVQLSEAPPTFTEFRKQLTALVIGIAGFLFVSRMHIASFRIWVRPLYIVAFLFLLAVLFFGATVRGTRGWFNFGSFSIQPVEFAKIALVLVMARATEAWGGRGEAARFLCSTLIVLSALVVLVILQPDLGSALILVGVWGATVLLAGIGWRRALLLAVAAFCAAGLSWFALADYQQARIRNFLNPARDPHKSGYNVTQAVIAVGSGQWAGRGLGFGSQSQLRFLPERHTDFIFATIAEELGFVGAATLLALTALLLSRLLLGAVRVEDDFARATLMAVAGLFSIEVFLNMGMNVGLLPVTGITLPLVSYGGSSLVAHLVMLGIASSAIGSASPAFRGSPDRTTVDLAAHV